MIRKIRKKTETYVKRVRRAIAWTFNPADTTPFHYYLLKPKLIVNSIFITPDRYFTIAGLIIAAYGFAIYIITTNNSTTSAPISFTIATIVVLIIVPPYASFFLTRKDTNDFTKVLSNSVQTDQLIKFIAFETLTIIRKIGGRQVPEEIRASIRSKKNSIRTVESLKTVLAKRLMISHRALSDDFLKFSAAVYINRQIYRANLLELAQYLEQRNAPAKDRKEAESNAEHIKNGFAETEDHLKTIVRTKIDLKEIEFIFQTRSIAEITKYFIYLIESNREILSPCHPNEYRMLSSMQQSHRTGVAIYRSIGMAISIFNRKLGCQGAPHSIHELREELLVRARAVQGHGPRKGHEHYLSNWFKEAQEESVMQRRDLAEATLSEIKHRIEKFRESSSGQFYIVIANYSRLVRYLFNYVSKRQTMYADNPQRRFEFKNINIVILVKSDEEEDFGTRLMFHHINNECKVGVPDLIGNTWRSTPGAFKSILTDDDEIVVLTSADRIGPSSLSKDDHLKRGLPATPQQQPSELHANIAYLPFPIEWLSELRNRDSNKKVSIIVVAGLYKYDLQLLIDQFDDETLRNDLRSPPRKRRRSGLYEWKSCAKHEVKVIAPPLSVGE